MEIYIRNSRLDEYKQISAIMKQVQQMHIDWRPDIYKYNETVLPLEVYEQAVKDKTFFVAEYEGIIAGILFIIYRHAEASNLVTRNTIFVDSMAVDKDYRGKGIGHAFFDFLKELKLQKGYDGIELQVNAKNEAAYKMYTDYGFTKKSINMEFL
ncbi:MAG: GNAT family N-acetyltransferase [Lachnospiraceae bacterium]|nr:GNAT family N-acetyltransferase [Lachnospiraceae bacterium]